MVNEVDEAPEGIIEVVAEDSGIEEVGEAPLFLTMPAIRRPIPRLHRLLSVMGR